VKKKMRRHFAKMGPGRAWLELIPIRALQLLLMPVPRRLALAFGRLAGVVGWALDGKRRRVALENVEASLPEIDDPRERARIVRRCFSHFGAVAIDCLLLPYRKSRDVDRLAVWEGLEHLKSAHLRGKGVFVISAHLGNWEMVALLQGWVGLPMAMVTRPLDNPLLERLFARGRTRSGNEIIHKRQAVRGIMKALRDGWCIALLIDQDFTESSRVFVEFFGRKAATAPTLGLLGLRTGAPIVPVVSRLLPDGRYGIRYLPPIDPAADVDRERGVLDIMSRCTALLEKEIRANPEQWLWMHRRWKTRPREREAGGVPAETTTA
jgi:KDO2-lipid IV(A) lauroyltransferase